MLKMILAVAIVLIALSAGLILAYAAFNTMYPEEGHPIAKVLVSLFTVFVFLAVLMVGVGGAFDIYV